MIVGEEKLFIVQQLLESLEEVSGLKVNIEGPDKVCWRVARRRMRTRVSLRLLNPRCLPSRKLHWSFVSSFPPHSLPTNTFYPPHSPSCFLIFNHSTSTIVFSHLSHKLYSITKPTNFQTCPPLFIPSTIPPNFLSTAHSLLAHLSTI